MSSKRAIRRKACDGKTRYTSFAEAAGAMRTFLRHVGNDGWPLSPYRCRFCNGFHFGHVPTKALLGRAQAARANR
jgi:hypothetical protein